MVRPPPDGGGRLKNNRPATGRAKLENVRDVSWQSQHSPPPSQSDRCSRDANRDYGQFQSGSPTTAGFFGINGFECPIIFTSLWRMRGFCLLRFVFRLNSELMSILPRLLAQFGGKNRRRSFPTPVRLDLREWGLRRLVVDQWPLGLRVRANGATGAAPGRSTTFEFRAANANTCWSCPTLRYGRWACGPA